MQTLGPMAAPEFLQAVEEQLQQAIASCDLHARNMANYLVRLGGKRLRPLLVWNSGSMYGSQPHRTAVAAAAAELVHTASLIHDDILDGAKDRRGQPSLHSVFGSRLSVLTGDFLFAKSFSLLVREGLFDVLAVMSSAVAAMCEAEMSQMGQRFGLDITEEQCIEHCRKKTASLMEACCRAGGMVGMAPPEHIEGLGTYGQGIGLAFQITDDILDLVGDDSQLGKPSGLDLASGVITLPIVHLLGDGDRGKKARLLLDQGSLSRDDIVAIRTAAVESGAVDSAMGVARECIARATRALQVLPDCPGRSRLHAIAVNIMSRNT
ncbi:MAG: polyprenyl synthetase family protein [Bacillota bacterium]